ncbi:TGS domain-containing protein [Candidatus Woesearchaeota archaeon]|nr:TGS domain-containing protein [Candidatus Woesearchaeota archaeon]
MDEPMILRTGSKLRDVCNHIHRDFVTKFRYAQIRGPSAKFDGQMLRDLDRPIADKDVVEVHTR